MSVVAGRLGMPIVHDSERKIWALGVAADDRPAALELGQAPDFALPDRKGNIVKLSDFRGKRVLLMTWASWCLCRQDLKGWQKVYEELKPQNFELIAVAEDTAGESAAGKYYDESGATFTTLIDVDHRVSALYQMVNVPMGVWIDEAGKVIRPAEVAYTPGFRVLGSKTGDDRYVPALRDWVANGPSSKYVLDAPTLKAKAALRPLSLREAELEFRIGSYLFAKGDRVGAREHWQRAQSLDPDNWNYHRQDWSFDAREATANWIAKVRKLGKKPYYDPITSLGDEVR
jgi:peroxiredoxin